MSNLREQFAYFNIWRPNKGYGKKSMGSIDDFVNHRWADAKATLKDLDRDFVDRCESEVWLQRIGLAAPWRPDTGRVPAQRLSTEWHRLLEACLELTVQESILKTSAVNLTANANDGLPLLEVGKHLDYHFRSWFIHARTLSERTEEVIRWTTKVYLPNGETRTSLDKHLCGRVYEEFTEHIREQRNQYAHGTVRSWGCGTTENQLWESLVSISMTPQNFLDEFLYLAIGNSVMSGKYQEFVDATTIYCDRLGSILQELEANIVGQ